MRPGTIKARARVLFFDCRPITIQEVKKLKHERYAAVLRSLVFGLISAKAGN